MPSVNPSLPAEHGGGLPATAVITGLDVRDIRFPTSRELDGSDAMNPMPDYSAAYLTLQTSAGHRGYSLVFTIGRGTDVQAAAIKALEPLVTGVPLADVLRDLGGFYRHLVYDSRHDGSARKKAWRTWP